jgi:hypothetical protein
MSYPKWVQREPTIGAVLCLNEAEEKKLLDDWAAEKAAQAKAAEAEAEDEEEARDTEVVSRRGRKPKE